MSLIEPLFCEDGFVGDGLVENGLTGDGLVEGGVLI